ncbi:rRNA processing/ribosome biogenesis-domain-containing protein [Lipomyces chichibuensis]|uniref:rRNA processing/ribosome biogenesis-domain-containing protein n=1 Tax=Lipomyces chichibuensis TaxID=1546026 RepID=UPI0033434742
MSANYNKGPSTSGSQLRSCLTTFLSPNHETLLPRHLGAAAACLGSSAAIKSSEPQILHRVRVRLSALLQSHSSEVRLCGAELIYTLVGVDWESLASHGATWIKLLLIILEKRNDNRATLRAVIRALCKLFALTRGKPTLTRELTTPNIPPFATFLLTLSLSQGQPDLRALPMTLPALLAILRDHPTTFRPFASKLLNNILYPILNSSSHTGKAVGCEIELLTRKLFVSMYLAVPKDQLLEWRIAFLKVIGETHKAISQTFDIVDEDTAYENIPSGWDSTVDIQDSFVGILRIEMLLRTVESFLNTATQSQVQVPVSNIVQLVDRLLSLDPENLQFKDTSDRIKQDFILSVLPTVHANVYGFLTTFVKTAGQSLLPHAYTILSHVATIPASRNSLYNIPVYTFLEEFLSVMAILPTSLNSEINHAVELALSNLSSIQHASSSLPDFASHPQAFISQPPPQITIPAIKFLAAVVGTAPDLPATTRSLIDRFSIVRSHVGWAEERLLLEGVLQPGRNIRWSIMPIATRKLPKSRNMGGILHPRFPPVPIRSEDTLGSLSATDLEYLASKHKKEAENGEVSAGAVSSSEELGALQPGGPQLSESADTAMSEYLGELTSMEDIEPAQPHATASTSGLRPSISSSTGLPTPTESTISHIPTGQQSFSLPTDTVQQVSSNLNHSNFKIVAPIVPPPAASVAANPVTVGSVNAGNEMTDRKRSREGTALEESKRPKFLESATDGRLEESSDVAGYTQISKNSFISASNLKLSVDVTTAKNGIVQTPDDLGNGIEIGEITTVSERGSVKQTNESYPSSEQDVAGMADEAKDKTSEDDGVDNLDDFVLPLIDTEWSSDEN